MHIGFSVPGLNKGRHGGESNIFKRCLSLLHIYDIVIDIRFNRTRRRCRAPMTYVYSLYIELLVVFATQGIVFC